MKVAQDRGSCEDGEKRLGFGARNAGAPGAFLMGVRLTLRLGSLPRGVLTDILCRVREITLDP